MSKISKLGIPFKSRTKEYQREWKKLNPDKMKIIYERYREDKKHTARKYRYGITKEQFENLLKEQNNKCAICLTTNPGRGHKQLHVDHDHETGKIRGLLCDKCNRGLGYFNDDSIILKKAYNYLWKSFH